MNEAVVVIRLHVSPVAAPRQTGRDAWNPSPAVVRYRAFRDELRWHARAVGYEPGERIDVVFHLPMPRSWSGKKKRAMDGEPHQQKPDTDNLLKAFCDALLPEDDCHVWDMRGRKLWAAEGSIEVTATR